LPVKLILVNDVILVNNAGVFLDLSRAQRAFSKTLQNFSFECIGESQTEDETHISQSLKEFGKLIASIEDERDRMVYDILNVDKLVHRI